MNFLVFLGTSRDSSPPRPKRLGARVAKACIKHFEHYDEVAVTSDKAHNKSQKAQISVELVDVLDYPLHEVFKPHFAYAKGRAPAELNELAGKIKAADGYIMISPEYNHSMSPALANLLNHFGSSLFSYKPSAIVTYSAGQWGGVRAAVNLRSFLSELGCLPVSGMVHFPKAHEVFTSDGGLQEGQNEEEWHQYLDRSFSQLIWWSEACHIQKKKQDPNEIIGSFQKSPSQRNTPS